MDNNSNTVEDQITRLDSEDGRYSIFHQTNGTHVQIFEYHGDAPRRVVRSFELPLSFLQGFLKGSSVPVST